MELERFESADTEEFPSGGRTSMDDACIAHLRICPFDARTGDPAIPAFSTYLASIPTQTR